MEKSEIRKLRLAQRKALSDSVMAERSVSISKQVLSFLADYSQVCVSVFLPIPRFRELNTLLIVKGIQQSFPDIMLTAPVVVGDLLTHQAILPGDPLLPDSWGIPSPQITGSQHPDIFFVPLLAFNRENHRIGYGKGFYDRCLTEYPNAQRIGLSWHNEVDDFDSGPLDIAMDRVLVP